MSPRKGFVTKARLLRRLQIASQTIERQFTVPIWRRWRCEAPLARVHVDPVSRLIDGKRFAGAVDVVDRGALADDRDVVIPRWGCVSRLRTPMNR
jgi:hypothetical protein